MSDAPEQSTQRPDPQYIIAAQQDELVSKDNNRMYLLATIKQQQAEYVDLLERFSKAKGEWENEKHDLLARLGSEGDVTSTPGE